MELIADAIGQPFYGLGEGEVFELHQEVDGIPADPTTKAVEIPFRWGYMKTGALLIVKGAESFFLSSASTFELYEIANNVINWSVLTNVGDIVFSNASSHSSILDFSTWYTGRKHRDRSMMLPDQSRLVIFGYHYLLVTSHPRRKSPARMGLAP